MKKLPAHWISAGGICRQAIQDRPLLDLLLHACRDAVCSGREGHRVHGGLLRSKPLLS